MNKYQAVIIEDEKMFRSMLMKIIDQSDDFELVGEADKGKDGWKLCLSLEPDIILLDLELPDTDGIELGCSLLTELPKSSILALTSHTEFYATNSVYESGFHGYVEKNQGIEVLEKAMLTVAEGGLYFTQLVRDNRFKLQSDPNAFYKIVSSRELEVLEWIAEGLTSQEIGEKMNLSQRTIENHKYRIMKKLDVKNATALMKYALAHGISRKTKIYN